MERIKEVMLRGNVMMLEAALLSQTLDLDYIRGEAARLLNDAGPDCNKDLRERLEKLAKVVPGSATLQ